MSSEYWKEFWRDHGRTSIDAPAQYQVLRTVNKRPVGEDIFVRILNNIDKALDPNPEDTVLDLCCGNGLITTHLAERCRSVVGIDCSPSLLKCIEAGRYQNVTIRLEDVAEAEFPRETFSKVLLYAGIQYFSERQIVRLFCEIATSMLRGGRFFVGDVPDSRRIWAFHDSADREAAYFDSVRDNKPIIGTWLDPIWLSKLARYAGFEGCRAIEQPAGLPFAHYRFDLVMHKP